MAKEFSVRLPDEQATARLGAALAAGTAPGRVAYLRGELGAGKTTLVRGLLRALGFAGRVKSPSYTLVEVYVLSSLNLYHFDFYRFKDPSEWISSGFRDYFNPDSVCLVEWPERAESLLPEPDLDIALRFLEQGREVTITARTVDGERWLSALSRLWPPP